MTKLMRNHLYLSHPFSMGYGILLSSHSVSLRDCSRHFSCSTHAQLVIPISPLPDRYLLFMSAFPNAPRRAQVDIAISQAIATIDPYGDGPLDVEISNPRIAAATHPAVIRDGESLDANSRTFVDDIVSEVLNIACDGPIEQEFNSNKGLGGACSAFGQLGTVELGRLFGSVPSGDAHQKNAASFSVSMQGEIEVCTTPEPKTVMFSN